jgi:putative hydrolase of the HAD superfamily
VNATATTSVRAVLFDATGTLLLFREPVGEVYRAFALEFGVDLPATRIAEAFGRILAAADPMVFPAESPQRRRTLERQWWWRRVRSTFRAADSAVRFTDFEACFDRLWNHYGGAAAWRLAPGTRQALETLRARQLPMAVVSNFDHRLPKILEQLEILEYFENVTIPTSVGAAKPDRRIFEAALAGLGNPDGRAVYVGDRAVEDVAGARGAGLLPIPVQSLATLAELPAHIDSLSWETE